MKLISTLAGGLAGAITVSIIKKVLRNTSPNAKPLLNGKGAHIINGAHKNSGSSAKWSTIGLYLAGGLVSAAVARWLEIRNKQSIVSPLNPPVESYKPVIDITV
jgi:putative effector of murein hydrolase